MEELLTAVKDFLDISGDDRDEDIQQIIEDGLNDMARVGILTRVDSSYNLLDDPQVIGCVKLYARYMVNYGGEASRYFDNYCHKRDALSLEGGFHA